VSITNSLAALAPAVAATWHPEKNGLRTPNDVVIGSGKRAWWRCAVNPGHEWLATIASRTGQGVGCPFCDLKPRSYMEVRLAYELEAVLPIDHTVDRILIPAPDRRSGNRRISVDIVAPSLRLVVEVDGSWWHREKQRQDQAKSLALTSAGWTVIRVREYPLEPVGPNDVVVPQRCDSFQLATKTLDRIAELFPRYQTAVKTYRETGVAQRAEQADRAIAELLTRRTARSA
jgi:hypothetical protein